MLAANARNEDLRPLVCCFCFIYGIVVEFDFSEMYSSNHSILNIRFILLFKLLLVSLVSLRRPAIIHFGISYSYSFFFFEFSFTNSINNLASICVVN